MRPCGSPSTSSSCLCYFRRPCRKAIYAFLNFDLINKGLSIDQDYAVFRINYYGILEMFRYTFSEHRIVYIFAELHVDLHTMVHAVLCLVMLYVLMTNKQPRYDSNPLKAVNADACIQRLPVLLFSTIRRAGIARARRIHRGCKGGGETIPVVISGRRALSADIQRGATPGTLAPVQRKNTHQLPLTVQQNISNS